MNKQLKLLVPLLAIAALLLAACGGGGTQATPTLDTGAGGLPTESMATEAMPTAEMMETEVMPTEDMSAATPATTEGAAVPSGDIDCAGAQSGDTISMLYQWSGVEEENLMKILQPLVDACGIVLQPETTRDQGLLDTRVQAGTPPDIAFWNVVQLQQYADQLIAVDSLGIDPNVYRGGWVETGSVNGKWVGLPVKGDIKTIVWYSPTNFEALGYTVPTTWEELDALVEQMAADGNVPWSMGFESGDATGWTASDWIQDILLVTQGPDFVRGLIDGSTSYADPAVKAAYEQYGKWAMDPKYTVGGAQGSLTTSFQDAIYQVFSDPPQAMMVRQSGFAGGLIAAQYPDLKYGTDYDFFELPGAQAIQTGSDWMMAFSDKPAVAALYRYIASEAGAQAWAATGFDISPNKAASGGYQDESLQKRADILYNAEASVPDIGDTIPGGFGSAEWRAIVSYINGGDLDAALADAAAAQKSALGQ